MSQKLHIGTNIHRCPQCTSNRSVTEFDLFFQVAAILVFSLSGYATHTGQLISPVQYAKQLTSEHAQWCLFAN